MVDTRRSKSALQTLLQDNASGDISAQDARDEMVSGHPESVVQSDTVANEPASGQLAGDLFLPSNGLDVRRYSGSAWLPWGPLWPLTKPVSGDFAWINQGSSTITTTNGGIYLYNVTAFGTDAVRVRKKTAPATPYTVTACVLCQQSYVSGSNSAQFGLCFRQSSDGKLVVFGPATATNASTELRLANWNSTSSLNASVYSPLFHNGLNAATWLRIADNGTNRVCSYSVNGYDWFVFNTVGRTSFLTADEVGFCTNGTWVDSAVHLLSWKEA